MLVSVKDELCGTVKLIFQPAEELASGAKHIVAQGALDGVDAAFGQHIFSGIPAGTVAIGEGALLPAADYFRIDVKGKASHGALPDEGIDATVAASAIVLALQTVSSREYSPLDPVVVTVGTAALGREVQYRVWQRRCLRARRGCSTRRCTSACRRYWGG